QGGGDPVSGFLERNRSGGVRARYDRLRDVDDLSGIGTKVLVWKGFIFDLDCLARSHKTNGTGRDQQLGLQNAVVRDDLKLQAPWIRKLADGRLEHRDTSRPCCSDDISAPAIDLGN